jgi:stage II sporulation protein E
MIAGILNKFGKVGVICGFVLGNIILSYVTNGLATNLILFKEILIAGIALLAVPKGIKLNIESIIGENKFLPVGTNRGLNRSKETVTKLNNVSKVVKEMADTYKNVATTVISEEDIREKNKQKFILELLNNIEYMEENILYDSIENVESKIVDDIFLELMEKQFIREKDLLRILARNNNYVVGFNQNEEKVSRDVEKMTEAINSAFRISKMNFIWSVRLNEEKKNFETQLNGVSKAISEIAEDIDEELKNDDLNNDKKEQITLLLKQKEILVQEITINKKSNDKYKIELYIEKTEKEDVDEVIINILDKVLQEKVIIKNSKEIKSENSIKYEILSDDKYILDIGHSIAIKDGMTVSGDSIVQTKLKDGKYLIAISDGMGSGPEARKSSQIVTSMLKRLLNSGFEKNTSVDLINSNLLNVSEDVFATLDIAIIDLYKGNIEFIKNGACPTYIKNNKKIQIIKSLTLPTGVIKEASTDIFDKDIENNDIIVMCSDGILDSNVEYKNKELWVKYLLEDIEITNPQKIADIILNEAVDNNFGKTKDDMSIVVCKLIRKN